MKKFDFCAVKKWYCDLYDFSKIANLQCLSDLVAPLKPCKRAEGFFWNLLLTVNTKIKEKYCGLKHFATATSEKVWSKCSLRSYILINFFVYAGGAPDANATKTETCSSVFSLNFPISTEWSFIPRDPNPLSTSKLGVLVPHNCLLYGLDKFRKKGFFSCLSTKSFSTAKLRWTELISLLDSSISLHSLMFLTLSSKIRNYVNAKFLGQKFLRTCLKTLEYFPWNTLYSFLWLLLFCQTKFGEMVNNLHLCAVR